MDWPTPPLLPTGELDELGQSKVGAEPSGAESTGLALDSIGGLGDALQAEDDDDDDGPQLEEGTDNTASAAQPGADRESDDDDGPVIEDITDEGLKLEVQ